MPSIENFFGLLSDHLIEFSLKLSAWLFKFTILYSNFVYCLYITPFLKKNMLEFYVPGNGFCQNRYSQFQ